MAFQGDDPRTYKVDAFGGVVARRLCPEDPRHARAGLGRVRDEDYARFELPGAVIRQIETVSAALLAHGAGYASVDLMLSGEDYRIIEMNTCGVGTGLWDDWPEQYAEAYSRAILDNAGAHRPVPRYRDLREAARRCGNDQQAIVLPRRAAAPPP